MEDGSGTSSKMRFGPNQPLSLVVKVGNMRDALFASSDWTQVNPGP
jgi:hypothetical protein